MWFKNHFPNFSYGILPPCRRCKYGKSKEPMMVISLKSDLPIAIVNLNRETFVRKGGCIGFYSCHKCIEQISNQNKDLPCIWVRV